MTQPELKPCPICGKAVLLETIHDDYTEIICSSADKCFSFQVYGEKKAIQIWNSAYCWKELEKVRSQLEKTWAEHDPAILRMAKEISKLKAEKEAYRYVAIQNSYQGVNISDDSVIQLVDAEAEKIICKNKKS